MELNPRVGGLDTSLFRVTNSGGPVSVVGLLSVSFTGPFDTGVSSVLRAGESVLEDNKSHSVSRPHNGTSGVTSEGYEVSTPSSGTERCWNSGMGVDDRDGGAGPWFGTGRTVTGVEDRDGDWVNEDPRTNPPSVLSHLSSTPEARRPS